MRLRVGVAALVIAVTAVAAGSAAPPTAEVTMPAKVFVPRDIDVLLGTTVAWRNGDTSTHTVTADEDEFDSGHMRPGATFSATFSQRGTFEYHCTIHRFMRGAVRVFDVVLRGPAGPQQAGRRARLDGIAPPGATELLLERASPGPAAIVGRAVPGLDGVFTFYVRAPEPRSYRVLAGSAASPRVRVRVAPHVRVEHRRGGFAVSTRPARPGSRVVLQEYVRERFDFVTVTRGRLDDSSRTTIEYVPREKTHLRAVVRGRAGWSDGVSRVLLVRPRSEAGR